jgi:tRNA (guanine37-N1)-methyltransferase
MFDTPFDKGVISKAIESGLIAVNAVNLRDYAEGRHKVTDDYQYGGGVGLVMKPEPLIKAVRMLKGREETRIILLDPRGEKFTQKTAERLAKYESLTFICGRYEGVDERVRELVVDESISVGDFVLTGGELAAMLIIDAVARLIPGVLGDDSSVEEESFTTGALEYPHYTRPQEYEGLKVPDVLVSGNHADILKWRAGKTLTETRRYRPDLIPFEHLDDTMRKYVYESTATPPAKKCRLAVALMHYPMRDKQGDIVTTSITNMDLHDISRTAATYGAERYFVVTPIKAQRNIAEKVIDHWMKGFGAAYNSNRREAFLRTELCDSLPYTIKACEDMWGERPLLVATTARKEVSNISAVALGVLAETKPVLLLFGTGWGFAPAVFEMADYVVEPILGVGGFNHLPVRSAVAILLDRITKSKI